MLIPWLDLPGVAERLAAFSAAADMDLTTLGTTAGADEIKDTSVTQPLVVAAALLAADSLAVPDGAVIAGHSVGELAAAAIAGVFGSTEAVRLAGVRGRAMALACEQTPTSMAAVMGGEQDAVLAALEERGLVGANRNGGGQIVAAGAADAIAALVADPPDDTRVIQLPVAGAFHTQYMAAAEEALQNSVAQLTTADPTRTLLTNATGEVVTSGAEYLGLLVAQVTRPVQWDECVATFGRLGVTGVIELPPSGALVGLVKRQLKGVATLGLKTPADLDKAVEFITEHSGVSA